MHPIDISLSGTYETALVFVDKEKKENTVFLVEGHYHRQRNRYIFSNEDTRMQKGYKASDEPYFIIQPYDFLPDINTSIMLTSNKKSENIHD
ncbi:MAG: hypothetical protein EAY65_00980 [Alphaproteobacteria bacterium]|nr:MAG: hypothetical protein EAY65_00980 [Alphaproteobacteria bacterium]